MHSHPFTSINDCSFLYHFTCFTVDLAITPLVAGVGLPLIKELSVSGNHLRPLRPALNWSSSSHHSPCFKELVEPVRDPS